MAENKVDVQAALGQVLTRFRDTICAKYAAEAEQIAKAEAKWTDRTGDARKLLKGYVIDDGETLGVGLAHRVEYGPYLERDGDGKNAVLKPTVESIRTEFMAKAREFFGDR
jgi:ethanolamine utilization microcompartment shell protein EutL